MFSASSDVNLTSSVNVMLGIRYIYFKRRRCFCKVVPYTLISYRREVQAAQARCRSRPATQKRNHKHIEILPFGFLQHSKTEKKRELQLYKIYCILPNIIGFGVPSYLIIASFTISARQHKLPLIAGHVTRSIICFNRGRETVGCVLRWDPHV